tara:strand:+ start:199 stop:372 length:174 start_codon:yes stop_codon:yes gene_type:complete
LENEKYYVMPQGQYMTMADCFIGREEFMRTAPTPKMNYDSICVQTNQITPPEDGRQE